MCRSFCIQTNKQREKAEADIVPEGMDIRL